MFNAPAGIVRGLMRRKPAFFTVVTDLADVHAMWFNSSPDRFFVASEDVRMKAVANGISPNKVTISGIPVDPEFNSSQTSKQERRFHLGLNPQLTTLLFVGSRRVSGVFDHIKALEGILHPFQVVVIAGGDEDLYQQCVQHTWRFPIHIENYVKNMPEWMLSADLLVTKAGGLILSEGLAAGLPIILIDYLPGQEEGNVRFIIEHQAGEIIQCTGNFLQLVNSWLWDNQTLLKNFAKNARMLGHPDSAFVVANALWEAADPYLA